MDFLVKKTFNFRALDKRYNNRKVTIDVYLYRIIKDRNKNFEAFM
jgi:hypothetical protein